MISYERVFSVTRTIIVEMADEAEFVPRRGACGFLTDSFGRILVFGSLNRGLFDVPGGGIDPGETEQQAVVREFQEETGLIVGVGERLTETVTYFAFNQSPPYRMTRAYYRVHLIGGELLKNGDGFESMAPEWQLPRALNHTNTIDTVLLALPAYLAAVGK